jgi:hypothetical protein
MNFPSVGLIRGIFILFFFILWTMAYADLHAISPKIVTDGSTVIVLSPQISYRLWRALMFAFWWTVIVYSMIVLIIIYTYQFDEFPDYWRNTTGWNDTMYAC